MIRFRSVELLVELSTKMPCCQLKKNNQITDGDTGDVWRDHSLVAAVPLPGIARPAGQKVSGALVFDSLREPEQHAGVVVSGHVG